MLRAEEPAAPSGNAFASFAASNSKSAFGTLSADAAKAPNSSSFGNGTSLGVYSLARVATPIPTSGYLDVLGSAVQLADQMQIGHAIITVC